MALIETSITDAPLDVSAAITRCQADAAGAIAVFVGTVRIDSAVGGNRERQVQALEYEALADLAQSRMEEIGDSLSRRFGLIAYVARHRTGLCPLGEPTVVVACAAPHRAEALEACRAGIDEIKASVPIWKKEIYSDGSSWVGAGG